MTIHNDMYDDTGDKEEEKEKDTVMVSGGFDPVHDCLLYTSPSPRDRG